MFLQSSATFCRLSTCQRRLPFLPLTTYHLWSLNQSLLVAGSRPASLPCLHGWLSLTNTMQRRVATGDKWSHYSLTSPAARQCSTAEWTRRARLCGRIVMKSSRMKKEKHEAKTNLVKLETQYFYAQSIELGSRIGESICSLGFSGL